ncbi:hypothetical protein [Streptomyces niveus]|uniref:hypothetical protein n=1 Tax=Streptomyces niveus TaxID=193462 RepID=UPI00341C24B2
MTRETDPSLPLLRCETHLEGEHPIVTYTFTGSGLRILLESHGVADVQKLPLSVLKGLCRSASPTRQTQFMEQLEARSPGSIQYVHDDQGASTLLYGQEGLRTVRTPNPDPEQLWNPEVNPVTLAIKVVTESLSDAGTDLSEMTSELVRVTFHPAPAGNRNDSTL